jgi:hypothetical protein
MNIFFAQQHCAIFFGSYIIAVGFIGGGNRLFILDSVEIMAFR